MRWWPVGLALALSAPLGAQGAASPDRGDADSTRAASADTHAARRYRVGDGLVLAYRRPAPLGFITGIPGTLAGSARDAVRREKLDKWVALAASTGIVIAYDQQILDETRRLGERIDLPTRHPSIDVRINGGYKVIAIPTTISSGLYFLGDGWVDMLIAGGLLAYGLPRHDWRALRAASEITEAIIASGLVVQTIKHLSGRESPIQSTARGGRWRPLPSWKEYNANVAAHDAFPSGHLAAATATFTVVALTYPEHRWIRPLGYTLLSALAFAMVNDGVHWAGDYPLALAIGGTIGKIAVNRGRTEVREAAGGAAPTDGAARAPLARPVFEPLIAPAALGVRVRLAH